MAITLTIADLHEPYCKAGYLEWCVKLYDSYKPDTVVQIGDEIDHHYLSYHEKMVENKGAGIEYEEAYHKLHMWMEAFPFLKICVGNHTALPFRKARSASIPSMYMKNYNQMWDAPASWIWEDQFEIDGVLYTHKPGKGLKMSLQNTIDARHRSTVFGHTHAHAGVYYAKKKGLEQVFALNVGWGGDHERFAFEYGKQYPDEGILGAGVVIDGREAYFIPFFE